MLIAALIIWPMSDFDTPGLLQWAFHTQEYEVVNMFSEILTQCFILVQTRHHNKTTEEKLKF